MDKEDKAPTKKTLATPTDDESITTSTESGTFDTWTLVTDKTKGKADAKSQFLDSCSRIEVLKEDETEEQNDPKAEHDSTTDDFSDGISIISESESAGRISPHPFLMEQLNNLNLKFTTEDFDPILSALRSEIAPPNSPDQSSTASFEVADDNQPRQRRKKRSSSSDKISLQFAKSTGLNPIVRRGIRSIFYVGVAMALLAFIGKIRYPEWEPLTAIKSVSELELKLADIELQNNLMRAEIDILTKQVNYLNTLSESKLPERGGGSSGGQAKRSVEWNSERKGGKTFKAWAGNGNSMDPVDITKKDLRRPYRCPDGKFVEIAAMCVESKPLIEPLAQEFGNAVNEVLEKSDTYKSFEKVAEQLHAFTENPFDRAEDEFLKTVPAPSTTKPQKGEVKINIKLGMANEGAEEKKHDRGEERYQKDYKYPSEKYEKYIANSKERANNGKYQKKQYEQHYRKQHGHQSDEDDDDDDSNERINKHTYYSKERYNKHEKPSSENNSKERYNKKGRHSGSDERVNNDGQWHEKLMQHRENTRRQNDQQRNNKNWYIERGDSREQKRHGEVRFR